MTLVPISLPPGLYSNGTPYSARQRWTEGNRVRWYSGSMRAIGGWTKQRDLNGVQVPPLTLDSDTETFRDALSWTDNANALRTAYGSNATIKVVDSLGVVLDITPAGFVTQPNQPAFNTGYGKGVYGIDAYGTPRQNSGTAPKVIFRWDFSTWGADLLASYGEAEFRGPLYAWSVGDTQAVQVPNAPIDVNGVVVTAQRIVMTIGSNAEPRKVSWSDREDRTDWTSTVANYAGSLTLQGTGALISIKNVLNHTLILSDTDAHVARYIGAPFVYGFDRVGTDCGPLHAGAVQGVGRLVMWLGLRNFWIYDGTVRQVPCDVMDFLSSDMSENNYSKITSGVIPQYSEIWWLYQSMDETEVGSYVSYNYVDGTWMTGKLSRTCLASSHGLSAPTMVRPSGKIEVHEQASVIAAGAYAITGPLEIGQGDKNMAVRYIFPDTQTYGDIEYTLLGKALPTDPEHEYGPYAYANPIATRALGRDIRMKVAGEQAKWEVGAVTRFDVAPVGTGMR